MISTTQAWRTALATGLASAAVAAMAPAVASAADSAGCEGGGFRLTLGNGTTLAGEQRRDVSAAAAGTRIQVRGRYVEFDVDTATLAVRDYAFTAAPNPLSMTGGRRIVAFQSKVPNLRGATLTSPVEVRLGEDELRLVRETGDGAVSMKVQAKDCAEGGLFQMEPERDDERTTRFTHRLGSPAFYFDNPNFRAREGEIVPFGTTTLPVPARVNIGSDLSARFVGRDSAQLATRVPQGCVNTVPAPRRPGGTATVDHCGGISVWDVRSGGRMGAVFGEDAVEVAPGSTDCATDCQAQNQVDGGAVVLGHPFPVPAASRLQPRLPA